MRVAVHHSQSRVHSTNDSDFTARKSTTASEFGLAETFQFADCEVRLASREVLRGRVPQKVERLTFDLIVYLIGNRGRVVSKEELLRNVWRNMFVSDSVITQSIMKARRALGDNGRARIFIRTVHRVGYKFDEELITSRSTTDESSEADTQSALRNTPLDQVGRETLAKAAEVMARELTRLGLTVRQVDSSETPSSAADMAEHIGLALHQSLSSHRGLLVDIASKDLRRKEAA